MFADIVNVLVLEGRQRIDPDDLTAAAVHSQYKADDGVLHEQERDVSKYWKKQKIHMALFGIENQTDIEKNMPFRVIGYDGAAYRQQLLQRGSLFRSLLWCCILERRKDGTNPVLSKNFWISRRIWTSMSAITACTCLISRG